MMTETILLDICYAARPLPRKSRGPLKGFFCPIGKGLAMRLDPTDEEILALLNLLMERIGADPFPLSPRVRMLRAILARFSPRAASAGETASAAHTYRAAGAEASGSAYGGVAVGVEPGRQLLLDCLFLLRCRFAAGEGAEHRVEPCRGYHS